jgi:hypothetical protein
MKLRRRNLFSLATGMAMLVAACSDDAGPAGPGTAARGDTIRADILTNRTLYADTTYVISGFVHVANGATLTIQAGTRILGDAEVLGSSLFVMRGAKIHAVGTESKPIVFTSSRPAGSRAPGDWGGLIIIGNGVINRSGTVLLEGSGTNQATNPAINYAGGSNNADDSGELRYVRIEFAGYATATDAELNALTLAAVGSGTRIEYVQTLAGLDDSFEFFGGAVDASHLVSYEAGDDHFDMSEGYQGRLQYLIGYQTRVLTPRTGAGSVSTDPQGIENDGCNGAGCAATPHHSTPFTTPVVANFTLVGRGDPGTAFTGAEIGMVLRRGTGGYYVNGVLSRWPGAGISVRDAATQQRITDGDMVLSNILVNESPVLFQPGQQAGVDPVANSLELASSAALFASVPTAPTSAASIDWSPAATAPQRAGGLAVFSGRIQAAAGPAVTGTAYRGAAAPDGAKWWANWTSYAIN